ncbi:MAG: hypothetical protein ACO1RA_10350 [Planctomycetaceae bacterium]
MLVELVQVTGFTIGGLMTDWQLWLVILLVLVIAWASLESRVSNYFETRRLLRAGRTIQASDALFSYAQGHGVIVRNRSSLPGRWWFYRIEDRNTDDDLWMTLKEQGRLVLTGNPHDLVSLQNLEGKLEEVIEPFED